MRAPNVLKISGLHITRALRGAPDYAAKVPGGVWRGVAPSTAAYPHITYGYLTGDDRPAFGGGWGLSNLQTLIKIVDRSQDPSRALDLVAWLEETLFASNGEVLANGHVYFERINPFSLPVVENDTVYQQEGGIYRTWVDEIIPEGV